MNRFLNILWMNLPYIKHKYKCTNWGIGINIWNIVKHAQIYHTNDSRPLTFVIVSLNLTWLHGISAASCQLYIFHSFTRFPIRATRRHTSTHHQRVCVCVSTCGVGGNLSIKRMRPWTLYSLTSRQLYSQPEWSSDGVLNTTHAETATATVEHTPSRVTSNELKGRRQQCFFFGQKW